MIQTKTKYKNFWLLVVLSIFSLTFSLHLTASDVTIRSGKQANGLRLVLDSSIPLKVGVYQGEHNKALLINVLNGSIQPINSTLSEQLDSATLQPLGANKSQAVLTFKIPVRLIKSFTLNPDKLNKKFRHVIDLSFGASPALSPTKQLPKPAHPVQVKPRKKIIIIDAGHGGNDPGTIGKNGTYEKDITLRAAKILAQALRTTGRYDVRLTRSTDVFIPLAQRVKFGRENQGDIFISLHADSSPRSSARGLSIYTLSRVASDREAARLAQKENKADLFMGIDFDSEIPEVANILIDLTKRETMNLSINFAQTIKNICPSHILMPTNMHRFANFAVLRTPDIPAVLIELGFLSNPDDERKLKDLNYLSQISSKIVEAIDLYFREAKS